MHLSPLPPPLHPPRGGASHDGAPPQVPGGALRGPLLVLAFLCILHLTFVAHDGLRAVPMVIRRVSSVAAPPPAPCGVVGAAGWAATRAQRRRVGPAGSRGHLPRVMIAMLDNRGLEGEREGAHFWSITAVANYAYARHHGYDFMLLSPAEYNASAAGRGLGKAACTHVGRGAARGLTWCKVLVLWALTAQGPLPAPGEHDARFEYVVYMDSDAVVREFLTPLPSAWHTPGNRPFGRAPFPDPGPGADDAAPALFFYSDRQVRSFGLANMGFVVARNTPATRPVLRAWWDSNSSYFDMKPHYEQAAFWELQESARGSALQAHAVVNDAYWAPLTRAQWLMHINSMEDERTRYWARATYFRLWLDMLNMTAADYAAIYDEMRSPSTCAVMTIDLDAVAAEVHSAGQGPWGAAVESGAAPVF